MGELIAVVLAGVFGAQLSRLGVSGRYRAVYVKVGKELGVDPNLLHALALQETRERANAVSPPNINATRDFGLMQINESNLSRLGLTPATATDADVMDDVRAAARLLADNKRLAPHFTKLDEISVYNAGFSTQTKAGEPKRAKLAESGTDYFNAQYVREAWAWYLLVSVASAALFPTANWQA